MYDASDFDFPCISWSPHTSEPLGRDSLHLPDLDFLTSATDQSLLNSIAIRQSLVTPLSPTTSEQNQLPPPKFTTLHTPPTIHSLPIPLTPVPLITPTTPLRMENKFDPIHLPVVLHDLPLGYSTRIRQFNGERGYLAREHLRWFSD